MSWWWGTHRNNLKRWDEISSELRARFQESAGPQLDVNYRGTSNPQQHIKDCEE